MGNDAISRGSDAARHRVLFHLKMRGPQTAAQLARRLDITPVAVRQHLRRLEEEGLVEATAERRALGRPVNIFTATAAAADHFPDTHADLTVELLGSIRATFGERGLDRLLAARARAQLETYRAGLRRAASLEGRVAALADVRRREGYMAEWSRQRDGSYLLVENHCPICIAARACQGLCRDELALFRAVFGPGAEVERTDHIVAGARRCAYRISRRLKTRRARRGS